MRKIKSTVLIGLVGTSLVLAGCGVQADTNSGEQENLNLTIGGIFDQTGGVSFLGPPFVRSAEIAVAMINEAAAAAGLNHVVNLSLQDGQSTPDGAVLAARAAIQDGATCFAGPVSSSSTIAVGRAVSAREGVLIISPTSSSDEISSIKDNGLINRTILPNKYQGAALVLAIENAIGDISGKKANMGVFNDAGYLSFEKSFSAEWLRKGGVIGNSVIFEGDQPSYNAEASEIVAGEPDVFMIIVTPETYAKLGPALVRTGKFDASRAYSGDSLASAELPKLAGELATEGLRGTTGGAPQGTPTTKAFRDAFHADGPQEETGFDAQTFDAVMLCYLAAVAAGSSDGLKMAAELQAVSSAPGKQYTFEQLVDAIKALANGEDIDYQGVSGAVDLDENGDPTSGIYDIWSFNGGEIETVDQITYEKK